MARRPYGYPRTPDVQQQMQVTGVPYISMRDPNAYQDWSQILESGQQRYDVSQSAIAKLLDEYSNARVSDRNAGALDEIVEGRLGEIKSIVKDRYDGQYGNAANEIVQRMASARKPIMQAQQAFEMEQKARDEYQQQLARGQAPRQYNPETKQFETIDFERYHGLPQSDFIEGKFVAPTFKALRGAADITGYLGKNISPALSAEIYEGILSGKKGDPEGYLSQVSRRGVPDEDIRDRLIDSETGKLTIYGNTLANQLRQEVTFLNDEIKDTMTDEQLIQYATPIIQGQVTNQLLREYQADRTWQNTNESDNPNSPHINSYDTIVKPGEKSTSISDIENRFSTFRKNRQYILNAENIKGKREALEPQINITKVSNALKEQGTGLTQFTVNGLYSVFNQDKNLEKNAVQGILQTYAEFYPEKAEKYLDRDSSGKFSFKVGTDARGLVASDFVKLVKDQPFEKIDKYIKEQNEYISTNHGILKQALDEGKITEDELFDLAEQSEREKALTFDVGVIPKDEKAIEEVNGMARFINTEAQVIDEKSGKSKKSKNSVWEEIEERGGIDRWTYNPLDGTIDYWTKNGGIVRTDVNKNGTKVVKELSGIISATIDSYYKNDVNETSISLPIYYKDEDGNEQSLKIKVVKQFDPINKNIVRRIGIEELKTDSNGEQYVSIREVRPDRFINEMFSQIELFKGERIQQKPKDPNK